MSELASMIPLLMNMEQRLGSVEASQKRQDERYEQDRLDKTQMREDLLATRESIAGMRGMIEGFIANQGTELNVIQQQGEGNKVEDNAGTVKNETFNIDTGGGNASIAKDQGTIITGGNVVKEMNGGTVNFGGAAPTPVKALEEVEAAILEEVSGDGMARGELSAAVKELKEQADLPADQEPEAGFGAKFKSFWAKHGSKAAKAVSKIGGLVAAFTGNPVIGVVAACVGAAAGEPVAEPPVIEEASVEHPEDEG